MVLKNITDVEAFMEAIKRCSGEVYLVSTEGDKINLKSELSLYIGIGELLKKMGDHLELFCNKKEDERRMLHFLVEQNEGKYYTAKETTDLIIRSRALEEENEALRNEVEELKKEIETFTNKEYIRKLEEKAKEDSERIRRSKNRNVWE